jgi:hypothetical protein
MIQGLLSSPGALDKPLVEKGASSAHPQHGLQTFVANATFFKDGQLLTFII